MTEPARRRVSYPEYLRVEEETGLKHEWLDGAAVAMAGATLLHQWLAGEFRALLRERLPQPCISLTEPKVRVLATGLATYPDVLVVCGPIVRDEEDRNAITNPTVIVEVLSPSTAGYDRGEKFRHYERIDTLREYVLVEQDRDLVERWVRNVDGTWTRHTYGPGQEVELASCGVRVPVDALYAGAAALR